MCLGHPLFAKQLMLQESMISSMGKWRMRFEAPNAEIAEMFPLARLLSRSSDPAVQSRSKEIQDHCPSSYEVFLDNFDLPGLAELKGRWCGSLDASGGGNGDTMRVSAAGYGHMVVQIMEQCVSMIHLREVHHTKRELHNVFKKKLDIDNLFEEICKEPDEVAMKRKRNRKTQRVPQQVLRISC